MKNNVLDSAKNTNCRIFRNEKFGFFVIKKCNVSLQYVAFLFL